uniref:Uncharacterized protein n=1 Tax=Ditylenchus dipsaci TaxID=166011 RepID=A0A915EJ25_9BILA
MTSPEQQQKKIKLEDDPYYIPSVPMYCVLGQQQLYGDLVFDLLPYSFQHSPPPKLNRAKGKTDATVKTDGAAKKIVVGDPADMTFKLKPRKSRSLIRPGRPSVAKKWGQAPAEEVKVIAGNLKDVQLVDAAVSDKIKSSPPVKPALSVKAFAPVQSVACDVLETRSLSTPPTQKSAVVSQMHLRSSDKNEELKDSSQRELVTPVKLKVSATSSTVRLRSHTSNQASTPETRKVDKQAAPVKKVTSVNRKWLEIQPICAKVPAARRSRSLVPTVASPSDSLVPVVIKQRVSSEVQILAEITNKPTLVVRQRDNSNKPSVLRDAFSTKKQMPPPPTPPLPTRSRAVKKGPETSDSPLNASGGGSVRSETPSLPRSRVCSYMTPTLSSSRRIMDTGRSRLPKKKEAETSPSTKEYRVGTNALLVLLNITL